MVILGRVLEQFTKGSNMHELLVKIIGSLAVAVSLSIIIFGIPKQIWVNYRTKTCGMDIILIYSAALTYTIWAIYAWIKPDTFLKLSNTPGTLLAWILVLQAHRYPRHHKEQR